MPKTKLEKQMEAIARKRFTFPIYIRRWEAWQPGGKYYEAAPDNDGPQGRQARMQEAEADLLRAAAEAQVDRDGKPLWF